MIYECIERVPYRAENQSMLVVRKAISTADLVSPKRNRIDAHSPPLRCIEKLAKADCADHRDIMIAARQCMRSRSAGITGQTHLSA